MARSRRKDVTQLLAAAGAGDEAAVDRLWSAVYQELHAIAQHQMAHEAAGQTLQATSLVHEAYLRLLGNEPVQWSNRRHFFAAAARAMRRIRIDEARRRRRAKRGGGRQRVPLADASAVLRDDPADVLAIDEALSKLERIDPRKAEIVMLRYFAGRSVDETARMLDISPRTVDGEWRFARAWLHRELRRGDSGPRGKAEAEKDG